MTLQTNNDTETPDRTALAKVRYDTPAMAEIKAGTARLGDINLKVKALEDELDRLDQEFLTRHSMRVGEADSQIKRLRDSSGFSFDSLFTFVFIP